MQSMELANFLDTNITDSTEKIQVISMQHSKQDIKLLH